MKLGIQLTVFGFIYLQISQVKEQRMDDQEQIGSQEGHSYVVDNPLRFL